MSARERAIEFVLQHEGGYVDDPDDPGGATNWGVSLRFLRATGIDVDADGDVDADDVRNLGREQAINVYTERFWNPGPFDKLDPMLAVKLFDLTVNMGPRPAARCLQRAVRAARGEELVEDGLIGPKALAAIDKCVLPYLMVGLRSEAAGFYRALVAEKPDLSKYLNGWLTRSYAVPL